MNSFKLIFPGLSMELIQRLFGVCARRYYQEGDLLIRPGLVIKSIVLVTKGRIKIIREDQEGKEFFIYYLMPGQACVYTLANPMSSEVSMISAKAIEDTEVFMIPIHFANTWMFKYKCWNDFVMKAFQDHLTKMMQVLDLLAFKNLDDRLEYYLEYHRRLMDCQALKFSHQEVANDIGSSREAISRSLKKMEARGKVKLHRSYIELT
ncbi:MAG: Crp/Fnr family transcriptional regulator [Saprospiraceae bacterium]